MSMAERAGFRGYTGTGIREEGGGSAGCGLRWTEAMRNNEVGYAFVSQLDGTLFRTVAAARESSASYVWPSA